jgi:hypothetical protein
VWRLHRRGDSVSVFIFSTYTNLAFGSVLISLTHELPGRELKEKPLLALAIDVKKERVFPLTEK